MRKYFSWFGWIVLFALPVIYGIEIYLVNDLPRVELWQWLILFGAVVVIYFSRDTDEVFKHHVVN